MKKSLEQMAGALAVFGALESANVAAQKPPKATTSETSQVASIEPSRASMRTSMPSLDQPKKTHSPDDELLEFKEALPAGAFDVDAWGKPYGWGFNKKRYTYVRSEADVPKENELSPLFTTRESKNKTDGTPDIREGNGRLRTETYESWLKLKEKFEAAAVSDPVLKEIGLWATETGRSQERQAELRKKLKNIAAEPGKSRHQLYTAIDLRNAKYRPLFEFLMGTPKDWKNPHFVPPLFQEGFVLDIPFEPWHADHLGGGEEGKTKAAKFWNKHRKAITRAYNNLIQEWPPDNPRLR